MTGPLAFDDNGELVEITDFQFPGDDAQTGDDVERLRRQIMLRFIAYVVRDSLSPEIIGKRVLSVAHLLHMPGIPKTQRELAAAIGITEAGMSLALSRTRKGLRENIGD
jgi:hypothetical protein